MRDYVLAPVTQHSMYFFSARPRRGRRRQRDVARWRTRLLQHRNVGPGEAADFLPAVHARCTFLQSSLVAAAVCTCTSSSSAFIYTIYHAAARGVKESSPCCLNADPGPADKRGTERRGAGTTAASSREGKQRSQKVAGTVRMWPKLAVAAGLSAQILSSRPEATLVGNTVARICCTRDRVDVDMGGYLIERGTWVPLGGGTTRRGR